MIIANVAYLIDLLLLLRLLCMLWLEWNGLIFGYVVSQEMVS